MKRNSQKQLWEKLAKENSRYYINSGLGKKITEEEFSRTGNYDFIKYIGDDETLKGSIWMHTDIILEIGCGTGRMTEFMAWYFKKVIGIDISSEMIKQAKERLEGRKNIELLETDGYTIPLNDNSVDSAFSYLVFQHMKTREMIESNFREVYRVLKPGGLFKVRVRTDKLKNMKPWWAGVNCDEKFPLSIGFKLLKKEKVGNYGLWLWLEK